MKIEIVRSDIWFNTVNDIDVIGGILDEAVDSFLDENCVIVNIETKEMNGLSRFWIYFYRR